MSSEREQTSNSASPTPGSGLPSGPAIFPPYDTSNPLWQVVLRQQQLQIISQIAALNPLLFNATTGGVPGLHSGYRDYRNKTVESEVKKESPPPKSSEEDASSTNSSGKHDESTGDSPPASLSTPTKSSRPATKESSGGGREKVFTCKICNRSFGYKHVLQNHERTHTGEKPFECKVCNKRFTRDHHLKTHMRLHTGEKPYSCSHCDRQFVQVANLRRHLRVHTGEKPYKCEVCSSCFSDSNQLKAHVLIHKGDKPFECEKCHGKYRRRHHLSHHSCPSNEAPITLLFGASDPVEELLKRQRQRKSREPKRMMMSCTSTVSDSPNSSPPLNLPVQTEPEDLSAKTTGLFHCQIKSNEIPH